LGPGLLFICSFEGICNLALSHAKVIWGFVTVSPNDTGEEGGQPQITDKIKKTSYNEDRLQGDQMNFSKSRQLFCKNSPFFALFEHSIFLEEKLALFVAIAK
jgi:hypothetical protein